MKNLFLFFSFMICVLGSFSLQAQDVTDAQVLEEMKTYLTHLNGEKNSDSKMNQQLALLKKVTELWKISEFRSLRQMDITPLLTKHTHNPYFHLAIAFHDDNTIDGEQFSQRLNSLDSYTQDLMNHAIQFRKKLAGDGLFTLVEGFNPFDIGPTADIGFDYQNPSHLLTITEEIASSDLGELRVSQVIDLEENMDKIKTSDYIWHIPKVISGPSYLTPDYYIFAEGSAITTEREFSIWSLKEDKLAMKTPKIARSLFDVTVDQAHAGWIVNEPLSSRHQSGFCLYDLKNKSLASGGNTLTGSGSLSFSRKGQHALIIGLDSGRLCLTSDDQADYGPIFDTHLDKPIRNVHIHPNNHLAAFQYLGTMEDFVKDPQISRNIHLQNLDDIHAHADVVIDDTLSMLADDFFFSPTGELVIIKNASIALWDVDPIQLIQEITVDVLEDGTGNKPDLQNRGHIIKVIINSTGTWMAALTSKNIVFVYSHTLPELDLDLLMLIDPDKISGEKK